MFSNPIGYFSTNQSARAGARVEAFKLKGHKLALTSIGEIFYCDPKKILDSVQEASEKARNHTGDFTGKISLAAPASLRYYYLPSFARFRAAYPSIKLTIFARSHADAIAMVRSARLIRYGTIS